jgi:CSLREA domain-containing protein
MRKRLLTFSSLILTLLFVIGLTNPQPGKAQGVVNLRIAVGVQGGAGANPNQLAVYQTLEDGWNNTHSTIKIDFEIAAAGGQDKFINEYRAGNSPDIVGPLGVQTMMNLNSYLADLESYYTTDLASLNVSDFDNTVRNVYVQHGKRFSVPLTIYPSFMWINEDLFSAAGLPLPPTSYNGGSPLYQAQPWNMAAVRTLAMQLTKDTSGKNATEVGFDPDDVASWGFSDAWAQFRGWATHFHTINSGVLNDFRTANINQSADQAAAQYLHNAIFFDHFMPDQYVLDQDSNMFSSGTVAMWYSHSWYSSTFSTLPFNWSVAVAPLAPDGTLNARLHADSYSMSNKTLYPAESWEVIKWLTDGPQAGPFATVSNGVPARISARSGWQTMMTQDYPEVDQSVVIGAINYVEPAHHEGYLPNTTRAIDAISTYWYTIQSLSSVNPLAELNNLNAYLQSLFDVRLVTKVADTNDGVCDFDCSLREAIADAPTGGGVEFEPAVTGMITLGSELAIAKDLNINGPGLNKLTISGGATTRIFNINSGMYVSINRLTISSGSHAVSGGAINNAGNLSLGNDAIIGSNAPQGAAINNTGTLTGYGLAILNNFATTRAGGIYNSGTATITSATISGNMAGDVGASGGGLYNAAGTLTVIHSTLVGNSATGSGGGASRADGVLRFHNSIIANNTTGGNCSGTITTGAANIQYGDATCYPTLVQKDPKLGPLGSNGGPSQTMALLSGSPAIDTANITYCAQYDQREILRPIDGDGNGTAQCDVGAYEAPLGRPIAPTLLNPSGTSLTSLPIFKWNPVGGASSYLVWVSSPSGTVFQTMYSAATVCAASPCSLTAPFKLWNNSYTWWVKAYNAAGGGAWSKPRLFTVNEAPPAPPVLKNPTGTILASAPNFTWTPSTRATSYSLWVSNASGTVFQGTYSSSICTVSLCTAVAPVKMWNGAYTFQVQGYGPGGYGLWSAPQSFTVNETVPATAVLISPTGTINTIHPTFKWNTAVRATDYVLLVTGPGNALVVEQQYNGATVCTAGICSVVVEGLNLTNANYTWRVKTYGPGGFGALSAIKSFTVSVTAPIGTTLISPTTTVNTSYPTFTWVAVPNATYYYLWVDDQYGNVFSDLVDASDYCSNTECNFMSFMGLYNGIHSWQVQPQGPGGYGPWTADQTFIVAATCGCGGAPALPSPSSAGPASPAVAPAATPVPTFVPR